MAGIKYPELEGTIEKIYPESTFVSKDGKDMAFLAFNVKFGEGNYPKVANFKTFNNSLIAAVSELKTGDKVVVRFSPESTLSPKQDKNGNDQYFSSLKALHVALSETSTSQSEDEPESEESDDLPF